MTAHRRGPHPEFDSGARRRLVANRILIIIASSLMLFGVSMGEALITWLNATLL